MAITRRGALWLGGTATVLAAGSVAVGRAFSADLARARERLAGRSQIARSRFGPIEYAVAGKGPPVLMVHGTGGGFDQGLSFTERLVARGYRIIAPSRFGYLRSAMPDDPSSDNQADALVDLLDALGIDKVPVLGGSAGALSAIAFAIRHPDRCSALGALVPATFVPNRAPVRPSAIGAAIMEYGLKSDFLFWSGLKLAPSSLTAALLATDPTVVEQANSAERARVRRILWEIFPVSARAQGLLNDAKLAGEPAPQALEKIQAPTLAISLEDDRFGTFEAAKHIATTVPGARLVSWPVGGHVWVGHDEAMFAAVDTFLRDVAARQAA
jgi:pimeloyl-ACP methyl ester carboxylesterase